MSEAATPQPAPQPGGRKIIDLVVGDLRERAEMGRAKYGTYLQAHNGREALVDAYQEALDLCMYLRQEITEARTRRLTDACDHLDCDRQRRELQAALTAGVEERREMARDLADAKDATARALQVLEMERESRRMESVAWTSQREHLRECVREVEGQLRRQEMSFADIATLREQLAGAEADLVTVTAERDEAKRQRSTLRAIFDDLVTAYPSDAPCPFCRAAKVLATTESA